MGEVYKREGTFVHLCPFHVDVCKKSLQYYNYPIIKNFKKNFKLCYNQL